MGHIRVPYAKKREIDNLLQQICTQETISGRQYCRYETGWNDSRVAAALGVSKYVVRDLRHALFGIVRVPPTPKPAPTATVGAGTTEILAQAIARVTRLEEIVGSYAKRLAELEENATTPAGKDGLARAFVASLRS